MSKVKVLLGVVLSSAVVGASASPAAAYTSDSEPRVVSSPYNSASAYSETLYVNSTKTEGCARPYGSSSITCTSMPDPRTSTSCGPGTWGDALVPDSSWYFNFTSACRNHDDCYGARAVSRLTCDERFYDQMLLSCGTTSCRNTAYLYYKAVRYFGWLAY